jgi:class 3 adenylate cyclase
MIHRPPTRYARSGDARIAYQVLGAGPDLIFVGGPVSHLDLQWEEPATVRSFERLASFCRLILFDRRGTGLSDPVERELTLDNQMDELQAVMDDIGVERTALMGAVDGGLCAMYAATHPERVTALILEGMSVAPLSEDVRTRILDVVENHWGEGMLMPLFAPSQIGNKRFEDWWARYERASVSPSMVRKLLDVAMRTDLRGVLPAIRVPTLVMHRTEDTLVPVEEGRAAAALIAGARFAEIPGVDAYGWVNPPDHVSNDIVEEFLTGRRPHREPQRALATVMFTDIVGSTQRLAELGDQSWRAVLDQHNALASDEIERWRGQVVKTVGDGFVATFDGPARGVRCAEAIAESVKALGIQVRAGLHTGECEMLDDDVGGIAVHISARVAALAEPGEVLVTSTVKELVVGSDLEFVECGPRKLRGVPGEWRLYRLSP